MSCDQAVKHPGAIPSRFCPRRCCLEITRLETAFVGAGEWLERGQLACYGFGSAMHEFGIEEP
jgi:hypothetical protein